MSKKLQQKLIGIALVIIGLITVLISYDATAAIIIVPIGAYLIVTKDIYVY